MSKGGSTTSSITIPEYIEAAAQRNLNKAERISQIGYTPYYGPDVAAFTPMQQAAFQGTAQTAGAFGLPGGGMSQQDIMGGMPAPTTYDGGVQGYSAAPIYEQSLQTLGERRPGQKSYIDSFFIDPYAGGAAAGNFAPIDYTSYNTMADQVAAAQGDNNNTAHSDMMASVGAQNGSAPSSSTGTGFASSELSAVLPGGVDDPFLTSPISQAIAGATNTQPSFDGLGASIRPVARPDGLGDFDPNQQASVYITDPASGITDTSTASIGTQIMNDLTEFGTGLASNTLAGSLFLGPSYNVGGVNNPIESPTLGQMQAAAPAGMVYQPSTGSYVTDDNNNTAHSDMMATSTAPVTSIRPVSREDAASGADTGDDGGCVVATHAVNSGAFSPTTKREAVVWCMNVLHGKWWGEAIRRGYRYLGRRKIKQGKAAEHYQEFRDYIAFASGKKRTAKGALHFAARTVQFLVVGLVKKDA